MASTMTATMATSSTHHLPPPQYTRTAASASSIPQHRQTSPRKQVPVPTTTTAAAAAAPAAAPPATASTATAAADKSKKPQLPPPPKVIIDSEGRAYKRGALLGQGGFARVYDAVDPEGRWKAFKVIAKCAIAKSRKSRQKILAEIMIHRSITHIHVVKFEDCFEDDENVYFRLELCRNGSLNDIIKKRGPFTEPEARYFMIQILAGTQHMHQNSIIHRDLKLGNVFLDEKMHVKIGDFGLAALLKYPEERKKTVCGTPNYIAPEILYDQGQGHSFEVDIWSVGVILYTLLVGKPPFQTSKVENIYKRIRKNDYEIPVEAGLSPESQDLIIQILTPNPAERPSLVAIMNHPWFQAGPIPLNVPSTATKLAPSLPPVTQRESLRHFQLLKQQASWNEVDIHAEIAAAQAEEEPVEVVVDPRTELEQAEQAEQKREKLDREFHHAIQPESPISALLKAGRQPLVKAPSLPTQSLARTSTNSLAKQLSSLTLSRGLPSQATMTVDKENAYPMAPPPPAATTATTANIRPEFGRAYSRNGNALQQQQQQQQQQLDDAKLKSRIATVTQAAPISHQAVATRPLSTSSTISSLGPNGDAAGMAPSSSRGTLASVGSSTALAAGARKTQSSIEVIISHLSSALSCLDSNELYVAPSTSAVESIQYVEQPCELNGSRVVPESPKVFLISWLDHSERYGLGYALSDGTVGVHFRDSTTMVLSASKMHVDYISTLRSRGSVGSVAAVAAASTGAKMDQLKRENFVMPASTSTSASSSQAAATNAAVEAAGSEGTVPKELLSRVRVMKYFESEIMDRLYGADSPLTFTDAEKTTGMVFVHKWYRCRDAIVFRLSNGTVQFNFYDHTKVFLTRGGQVVSVIEPVDKTGGVQTIKSWTLEEFISIANNDRSQREAEAEERRRFNIQTAIARTKPTERRQVRNLVKKIRYARDVLNTTVSKLPRSSSNPSSSLA
ncbi:Pkinase-domain-containing protein, partial [Testicularia cyperi]